MEKPGIFIQFSYNGNEIDGYLRTLMKLELPYALSDKEIDHYFEKA